jgi:hypothetical protein
MTRTTPVACTLSPADLATQGRRWEQLIARAMTERAETVEGLRVSFVLGAEDEVRALVAVETECCPWATWAVERGAGTIVLNVRSTSDGVAALRSMFTSPRPAR